MEHHTALWITIHLRLATTLIVKPLPLVKNKKYETLRATQIRITACWRVSRVVSWPALDAHIWASSAAAFRPAAGRRPLSQSGASSSFAWDSSADRPSTHSSLWRPQHLVLKWDLASGKRVAWNILSYDIYVIAFNKAFFCWCLLIKSYKELSSLILRFERLCAFLKSYHLPFLCLISAHKW